MEANKIYHGFRLIYEKEIKEINSICYLFKHEKSGARLFKIKNDDDNKVFSISFRTPPKNSKGIPHIMEHSVLCGSRKFKTKEPFIDLLKGSLNTFLNAFTFPDKTMYPVASRNKKDFFNLMDVYLDAALYPAIYTKPEILKQEGWHYEILDKNDDIKLNGVVYNEMKGAFSSPDSLLQRKVLESLFPDTAYGKESGGDPDYIPQLTYKEFVDFHKKYYHPTNSYIYLYGDGNIDEELEFLDKKYLSAFNMEDVDSEIKFQNSFGKMKDSEYEYSISEEEDEREKTFFSMNYVLNTGKNSELYLAMEILSYILLDSPSALLKKALIDAKLGKDVYSVLESEMLQPTLNIVLKGSDLNKKEAFLNTINDTLKKIVKEGIPKKLIEAAINIKEFSLREADFRDMPKGLYYSVKCMDSWLYDMDPSMHLFFEDDLRSIKSALTTNYFEDLIQKYLLNNEHTSLVTLKPVKGLADKKAEDVKKKLEKYKDSLSENEILELVKSTKDLKKMQEAKDTKEQKETIPTLSIDDIDKKSEVLPITQKECDGVKVLEHNVFTNKIAYMDLYFDSSKVRQELIPYISLLGSLLGNIDTKERKYEDLTNEVSIHTGGIYFVAVGYEDNKNEDNFFPKIVVKGKSVIDKLDKLTGLTREIINDSIFDDKKRIFDLLNEIKSQMEMRMTNEGHAITRSRLFSYFSASGKYNEMIGGIEYYKFISKLLKDIDSDFETIRKNLIEVKERIFTKENLLAAVTIEDKYYGNFEKNIKTLIDALSTKKFESTKYVFDLKKENEGLLTPAGVQYAAKGYNLKKIGAEYTGKMEVLKTILGLDYLWTNIRVLGGAYGAFAKFSQNGNVYFGSYRDPNLKETLDIYDHISDYVRSFNVDSKEMAKYIIGTISTVDTPLTPSMKGDVSNQRYIRKITDKEIQENRDEILSTTAKDINNFADVIKKITDEECLCVMGGETKINSNKSLFNSILNVFE